MAATRALVIPVILTGGAGTRLWPTSRRAFPKQFSKLVGSFSLFQQAATMAGQVGGRPPLIVTGEPFRFIIKEQLQAIEQSASAILIEPDQRNTAPAILLSALHLQEHDPESLMLVMPSDHFIPDRTSFRRAVEEAVDAAQAGRIVTFGVQPTRAEPGFGYLELDKAKTADNVGVQPLRGFVEKPVMADAEAMLASGRFLWNAGIFLFSVRTILAAFAQHVPDMVPSVSRAYAQRTEDLGFTRVGVEAWRSTPTKSIDYAIMEKADNMSVVPYAGGWADLGDWSRIWLESLHDARGNVISGETTAVDCSDSLLRSESKSMHLVGVDLDNMLVVAMSDAVLVAPMSASHKIGKVVAQLSASSVKQAEASPRERRPWGWFESIAAGDGFQVKQIEVNPGESMSLQSHQHRSEHWVIVAGTATVTIENEVRTLSPNESVYIPAGTRHRLENRGQTAIILIEVQTGAYLGEDDIIRYRDQYSRSSI